MKPIIAALDLEGVLIPEIWINVAKKTGIEALKLTTRDIQDYDELMTHRLKVLDAHQMTLQDIQKVIAGLRPLEGASTYLEWLKEHFEVVILSDTFYEFAFPLMKQLGFPTLFCHTLEVDVQGRIKNYCLRQQDQKTKAVQAFRSLNFHVIASGDSYNDTGMLKAAHAGILFDPPDNVIRDFPQFPVARSYDDARVLFLREKERLSQIDG